MMTTFKKQKKMGPLTVIEHGWQPRVGVCSTSFWLDLCLNLIIYIYIYIYIYICYVHTLYTHVTFTQTILIIKIFYDLYQMIKIDYVRALFILSIEHLDFSL